MKIAVASENEMVTEHFGHCLNFNVFEIEKIGRASCRERV